jgi:hypothetical protein
LRRRRELFVVVARNGEAISITTVIAGAAKQSIEAAKKEWIFSFRPPWRAQQE